MRPRDRVLSHLRAAGDISDPGGLASTALAEAVGYPGSSVAFAQLLSAMERSGLIEREIRGRRTYRIQLAKGARPRGTGVAVHGAAGSHPEGNRAVGVPAAGGQELHPGTPVDGLDYDELARRLLIEVVRRLAAAPAGVPAPNAGGSRPDRDLLRGPGPASNPVAVPAHGTPQEPGHIGLSRTSAAEASTAGSGTAGAGTGEASAAEASTDGASAREASAAETDLAKTDLAKTDLAKTDLAKTVASLERKLASVQSRQRKLRAENTRLREMLAAAERSLAEQQHRAAVQEAGARPTPLDPGAVQVLERLLSSLRRDAASGENAQAG